MENSSWQSEFTVLAASQLSLSQPLTSRSTNKFPVPFKPSQSFGAGVKTSTLPLLEATAAFGKVELASAACKWVHCEESGKKMTRQPALSQCDRKTACVLLLHSNADKVGEQSLEMAQEGGERTAKHFFLCCTDAQQVMCIMCSQQGNTMKVESCTLSWKGLRRLVKQAAPGEEAGVERVNCLAAEGTIKGPGGSGGEGGRRRGEGGVKMS